MYILQFQAEHFLYSMLSLKALIRFGQRLGNIHCLQLWQVLYLLVWELDFVCVLEEHQVVMTLLQ